MTVALTPITMPPLHMTVAVTGHRNLHGMNEAALMQQIASLLQAIETAVTTSVAAAPLDASRPVTLRLLSGLAAGADQLTARTMIEARGASSEFAKLAASWKLQAIIPYMHAAYRAGLGDSLGAAAAQQAEVQFDVLTTMADATLELADWAPAAGQQDIGNADLVSYWRDQRYSTLGQLLVRQADLLIALWRGTAPAGRGGTADVVAEAMRMGVPVVWLNPETGRVISITEENLVQDPVTLAAHAACLDVTSPDTSAALAIDKAVTALLTPTPSSAHQHAAAASSATEGLQSFLSSEPLKRRSKAVSYSWLLWLGLLGLKRSSGSKEPLQRWPGFSLQTDYLYANDWKVADSAAFLATDQLVADYAFAADVVATRLGHMYRSTYVLLFLASALAVGAGLAGLLLPKAKTAFVVAEILIIGLATGLYFWSNRQAVHSRWLNGRHLVERLRGGRMLAWLGFGGRRLTAADAPWSAWLANSIMALPGIPAIKLDVLTLASIAEAIHKSLASQIAYHQGNGRKLDHLHIRLDGWGRSCVIMATFVAVVYVALALGNAAPAAMQPVVTFAGGFLPACAAALAGIRFQGDFERFAIRSNQTRTQLARLSGQLTDFRRRAVADGTSGGASRPLYEELLLLAIAVQNVFEQDVEDWRFVYATRHSPEP